MQDLVFSKQEDINLNIPRLIEFGDNFEKIIQSVKDDNISIPEPTIENKELVSGMAFKVAYNLKAILGIEEIIKPLIQSLKKPAELRRIFEDLSKNIKLAQGKIALLEKQRDEEVTRQAIKESIKNNTPIMPVASSTSIKNDLGTTTFTKDISVELEVQGDFSLVPEEYVKVVKSLDILKLKSAKKVNPSLQVPGIKFNEIMVPRTSIK